MVQSCIDLHSSPRFPPKSSHRCVCQWLWLILLKYIRSNRCIRRPQGLDARLVLTRSHALPPVTSSSVSWNRKFREAKYLRVCTTQGGIPRRCQVFVRYATNPGFKESWNNACIPCFCLLRRASENYLTTPPQSICGCANCINTYMIRTYCIPQKRSWYGHIRLDT